MSRDNYLSQQCSHVVRGEVLLLDEARVSARPHRPIANASSVRVRLNGLSDIPSEGVRSPAKFQSKNRGPFTVGAASTLELSLNGTPITLRVAPGRQRSAEHLAREMAACSGDIQVQNQNEYLVISSRLVGPSAALVVLGGGLASVLGLVAPRVWTGKTQTPGWSLVNDPGTLGDRPTRIIVFDTPLQSWKPLLEVSYSTVQQECRRCGGLGTEMDWTYLPNGNKDPVRDADLLNQEIQKFTFTLKGSNRFHGWYGTGLLDAVGKKMSNVGLIQNLIVSELYEGFRRWQSIKRQQEDTVGQMVSDQEFPQRILQVSLDPSPTDPTVVFVNATIQSRARQQVGLSRAVRLPYLLDFTG